MNDTISRQAAIDAVEHITSSMSVCVNTDECYGMKRMQRRAVIELTNLPSAQPYSEADIQKMQDLEQAEIQKAYELGKLDAESRWIPCSERLPEPRMAVLGYAPRYQNIYALYYDSVDGWMVWSPVRDDFFPNSQGEIVAWMPLPEPYKDGEKDDN